MAFAVEMEVEDDVFFRINFQQFTMHFRNEVYVVSNQFGCEHLQRWPIQLVGHWPSYRDYQ